MSFLTEKPYVLLGLVLLVVCGVVPGIVGDNNSSLITTESDPVPLEQFILNETPTFIDIVGNNATVRWEGSFNIIRLDQINICPLEQEEKPFIKKITTRKVTSDSLWYYKVHDHVYEVKFEIHINLR